jgi:hypothetical protein
MNIMEKELFQVAAEAANAEYSTEERKAGLFVVAYKNKVYTNVKYALAALATELIKNELELIKDK